MTGDGQHAGEAPDHRSAGPLAHPDHAAPPASDAAASEAALLQRLRSGDDAAFEQLVRELTPRLLTVAGRITRSRADAEDVVQEAFLSAFSALADFDGRSALSTWMHRIVVNAALTRARRTAARRTVPIDDLLPTFSNGRHATRPEPWRAVTGESDLDPSLRESLRAALEALPDEFRAVVMLRDMDGMPSADIAAALGISDALVRQRLHRGRQALIKLLAPSLKEASA